MVPLLLQGYFFAPPTNKFHYDSLHYNNIYHPYAQISFLVFLTNAETAAS